MWRMVNSEEYGIKAKGIKRECTLVQILLEEISDIDYIFIYTLIKVLFK